jgi:serine phosphatase RsbU (regulator of sigma subunit)/anti-sigma regulatory factor (Ser/Thr protein kinase)
MAAVSELGIKVVAPPAKVTASVGGQLELPAHLDALPPARDAFVAFLSAQGLRDLDAWKLVFTEAVSNAVRHGCGGKDDETVSLEWSACDKTVRLTVSDSGLGPDEELVDHPELPEDPLAEGGRGFFIIQQLCDRVEHWGGSKGYRLVLEKDHAELEVPSWEDAAANSLTMDALLGDLATSYECMSAFHRMGAALISGRGAVSFISEGLESLTLLSPARDGMIKLCLSENVRQEIRDVLSELDDVWSPEEAPLCARDVLQDGQSFFWNQADEIGGDPLLEDFASGGCFPVVANGKTLGCLVIGDRDEDGARRAEEFTNLRTFSDLFGIALANSNLQLTRSDEARALKELEIAAEIQRNLLPILPPPVAEKWEIVMRHESAYEVAGDYVESCLDSEGNLVMVVIDVMGKGVSAAMLATLFRTGLHLNLSQSQPLNELVESVNDVLTLQLGDVTMFITCAIVRIDPECTHADIVNAGHCPVVILNEGKVVRQVEPSGAPLGLFADANYEVERIALAEMDGLLMVSDGVFEWETRDKQWWGWDNLVALVSECGGGDHHPDVLWSRLKALQREHGGAGAPLKDDQTFLYWSKKQ